MRTTLTLNDGLYERIVQLSQRRKISFKEAVGEVVRLGLEAADRSAITPYRCEIAPHLGGPLAPEHRYAKIADLLDGNGEERRW